MNLLSSHMASVFHYTTQFPIQPLHCQFELPVAQATYHVLLLSCFYPTCRLLTNLFFCLISEVCFDCRIVLDVLAYFGYSSKPFFPTTFHFLSNYHPLLNLTFQSNGSILVLLSRFFYNSVSVVSPCSLLSSSVSLS